MHQFVIIQVAIILLITSSHGSVVIDPDLHDVVGDVETVGNLDTVVSFEPQRMPRIFEPFSEEPQRVSRQAREMLEMSPSDSSLVEVRSYPPDRPEQSGGNQITSSVRRVSASVGISEVVGNSTRQISVKVDEEKPFIAVNLDELDSEKETTFSTTTTTTTMTTTATTTTTTLFVSSEEQQSSPNFVIKQVNSESTVKGWNII